MRWMAAAVASMLLQPATANLPPAYPRAGATKILDNDRVQVWDIAWPKGQASPLHRHVYDLAGVYYEPGDRMIISPDGAKRQVSTPAWATTSQRAGLTHIEEGISDSPLRAVFVELKRPGSYGTDTAATAPAFSGEAGIQKLDNDRVVVWEFTTAPPSRPHYHPRDTVVVSFGGDTPAAEWIGQGVVHSGDGTAHASRVYVFEIK